MILFVLILTAMTRSLVMKWEGRKCQGVIDSARNVDHVTEN